MANEHYLNEVNLDDVTSATTGTSVATQKYSRKTIGVNVSVNTGAVTVTIQWSPDNSTWFDLDTKTYTAATGNDTFEYDSNYAWMRTKTSTQSTSTVKTWITGRQ